MPILARRSTWMVVVIVLVAASCTNDYEQFDFAGGPPRADASSGQGGAAGTAQGSGGQLGSAPDSSISDSGGAPGDAQGGTGGGGTAGAGAQGGASGGGAAGAGTGGGGTGGQVGAGGGGRGGSGGGCDPFEVLCGSTCTDARNRGTCGGCDNDCEQQGLSDGFNCIDMRCGCTTSSQCGSGGRSQRCSTTVARCICNENECQAGERCGMTTGNCTCNGGPPCADGQICCQSPSGCRTGSCD